MPGKLKDRLKLLVLDVLSREPMHGYALMKRLAEVMGYPPSSGMIYPLLREMLEEGLVEVRVGRRGGRVVKTYHVTEAGAKYLEERRGELERAVKTFEALKALHQLGAAELGRAVKELLEALPSLDEEARRRVAEVLRSCAETIAGIVREASRR